VLEGATPLTVRHGGAQVPYADGGVVLPNAGEALSVEFEV